MMVVDDSGDDSGIMSVSAQRQYSGGLLRIAEVYGDGVGNRGGDSASDSWGGSEGTNDSEKVEKL